MRKILLLLVTIATMLVNAQKIEITPMGGYSFVGSINFYEGKLDIKDNASYGIKLGFSPYENSVFEFSYQGSTSKALWSPYSSFGGAIREDDFQMSINYFTVNMQQERMLTNENFYGFGAFGLGLAYMNPIDVNIDDVYSLALNFELGVKYFITDKIGIRLQASMQMPLYFYAFGYHTGGYSGVLSLSSGPFFVQGGFSGGLIIRI